MRWLLETEGLPLIWLVLTVMVLVPVWSQRLIPMLDTPNHLALVRAWHSFHDPSYRIANYYRLRIRWVPYILYYLTVHLLMFVVSIETANKIFLSAYLIAFPFSILALARAFGRSPWLALGGFPLAFSQNWIYGFESYLMGTALMFFSLAALIRVLHEGRRSDLVVLGLLATLTYSCHVLPWFVLGLLSIALILLHRRRWRRGAAAAFALLPSLMIALHAIWREHVEHAYMKSSGFAATWRDFPTSVMEFPRRVMELFPGPIDMLVLAVLALTIIGLCAWQGTELPAQAPVERKELRIILGVLALVYLSLPYQVTKPMYWWYISPRIPSMMAPFLLLLPAVRIRGWARLALLPLAAAALILPLKLETLYRGFSRRNAGFMRLIQRLPRGTATLVVVRNMGPHLDERSGDPATSAPVYWQFSCWPMALKGGYSPYVFNQGIPIAPKVDIPAPQVAKTDLFSFHQAPGYDYYIIRDPLPTDDNYRMFPKIAQDGRWSLYQRDTSLTNEP